MAGTGHPNVITALLLTVMNDKITVVKTAVAASHGKEKAAARAHVKVIANVLVAVMVKNVIILIHRDAAAMEQENSATKTRPVVRIIAVSQMKYAVMENAIIHRLEIVGQGRIGFRRRLPLVTQVVVLRRGEVQDQILVGIL